MEKARKKEKPAEEMPPSISSEAIVYIVEDDAVMREYLEELIRSVDLHAETFDSAEAFLKHYKPKGPGCMLLDVRMPGMSGLELQEKLRADEIHIPTIIVTAHADVPMAVRAMHSGAYDFIEKPVNAQGLLERVRHAVEFDINHHKSKGFQDEIQERIDLLSPREREVMGLVVQGKLNKQIAAELDLSIKTVEVHRARVMDKMQADNLAELIRVAIGAGVASVEDMPTDENA